MSTSNKKMRFPLLDVLMVFVFCFTIFSILLFSIHTDIELHIKQIIKINANMVEYPPNFLFYYLVNCLSGFSNHLLALNYAAITLLSLATTSKYAITKQIILDFVPALPLKQSNNFLSVLSFALLLYFAIPDYYNFFVLQKMYLGRIVPMVWHNSTTIFVFPFALLLFRQQLFLLNESNFPSNKQLFILNLLVIINILIKPSFLFVFIPVSTVLVLNKYGLHSLKKLLINLSPAIVGLATIMTQYFYIYLHQTGSFQKEPSSVIITFPFELYRQWIPLWYLPFAFLLSFLFPIFAMIFYRDIFKYPPFLYALYLTISGIILSAFLLETGPRMTHGNFIWQNVICAYLLIITTVSFLIPKFFSEERKSKKFYYLSIIFIVHVLSGILYLIKIVVTKSYL